VTATDQAPVVLADVRTTQRRWRWVKRMLWVALVVALLVGALWVVWRSPLLAVQQITVRGTTALTPERVIEQTNVPLGTPLAAVDTEAVAERVRSLPRVGFVEVRRGFPHELVVVVDDRIAVAVISAGGRWRTIDSAGQDVDSVRAKPALPIIVADSEAGTRAALAVIAAVPKSVKQRTRSVSATSRDSVELTLESGAVVRWGDASESERKAEVLVALLRQPGRVYDVSAPGLPTIRQ